jgi:hypothetical protein
MDTPRHDSRLLDPSISTYTPTVHRIAVEGEIFKGGGIEHGTENVRILTCLLENVRIKRLRKLLEILRPAWQCTSSLSQVLLDEGMCRLSNELARVRRVVFRRRIVKGTFFCKPYSEFRMLLASALAFSRALILIGPKLRESHSA